jgi:hypothetical protein
MDRETRTMKGRLRVALLTVTAAALLIGAGVVVGGGKPLPVNPDKGLTEDQVIQRQAQARAAFEDRLAAWFKNLDVAKLDLRSLPHAERLVSLEPPAATFADAVREASVVVTGTVSSISPQEDGTIVTLTVDATLKGATTSSVSFMQVSTLRPTADWSGTIIADSPGTPLLLPGTQGEFLLDDSGVGDLALQDVAGAYLFDANGVKTQPLNPFSQQLGGMTRDALVKATESALK